LTWGEAINAHDLDALVACFAEDYRNDTPAHPARGFTGSAQVRANWTRILGGVPDLTATLLRTAGDADVCWAEWDFLGARPDGADFHLAGVTVLGVAVDGRIAWARFYLEPVDDEPGGVDAAVRAHLGSS
jgi:ketosteroid isomerase-like protein